MRRSALGLLLVVLALVVPGSPAGADPARPTNFRSQVTSIEPPTSVVQVEVVGGDGFLDMRVEPGHEVVVEGYDGEPYLRFRADGTVQENQNSPATYLNRNRYAGAQVPEAIAGDGRPPPSWKTVATNGRLAWHDHRIHFMGSDPSAVRGLSAGDPVEWSGGVPFTVDGEQVVARGNYRLLDAPSPLPWMALAAAVTVVLVLLGRRRPVLVAGVALLAGGAASFAVGWAQNSAIPPGAGATPLTVALPVVAMVTAAIAIARSSTPTGVIAALASAATTGGWVLTRYAVFTKAVLPTDLSPGLDRAGTAVALAAAIGGAILTVRSGGLSLPRLDPLATEPGPAPPAPTASPPA
jgi:hypothetical protein